MQESFHTNISQRALLFVGICLSLSSVHAWDVVEQPGLQKELDAAPKIKLEEVAGDFEGDLAFATCGKWSCACH